MPTQQQTDFVQRFWCPAAYVGGVAGWFPEVVMATWAWDTGFGVATGMINCHALLGIACPSVPCPGCTCDLCNPSLCFYCYPDFDTFFRTFLTVIQETGYDVVRAQGTIEGQIRALSSQTNFAGGESGYGDHLISILPAISGVDKPICNIPPPCPAGEVRDPATGLCIPPPGPVPIYNGALVTYDGSGGQLWQIANGQRRRIVSLGVPGDVFAACGYNLANIRSFPREQVLAMPAGPDIVGPPDCPYGNPAGGQGSSSAALVLLLAGGGLLAYALVRRPVGVR